MADVQDVLKNLIETCKDAHNGFREAAEHVKDPQLKTFFNQQSGERQRFASELEGLLSGVSGEVKKESGSVAAAAHRAWIDLKSAVTGGDDHAILAEAERGEDSAKKQYEEALASNLPANVLAIVQRQAASVLAAHDQVRNWRDARAA